MEALAAFSIFCACVLHAFLPRSAHRLRLAKPNFRGDKVFSSYGIVLLADISALTSIGSIFGFIRLDLAYLYLSVMGSMCLLGLADDVFGTREVGGFKGHFRKLILERKPTTGVLKALGGAAVGIAAGARVYSEDPIKWMSCALLVALGANFLNILDLRPGRAAAVFFAGIGVTCCVSFRKLPSPWLIAALVVPTAFWGIVDSRGRAMMGDSGSNSLGAALGLTAALSMGLPAQLAAIVLLVAIHWYSEKHSLTDLIENNRVLRAIDARLGVR
ncbi:MAG: hypothetical protein QHI38_06840 [Armatimonadota bacterium]|nr:hypothetical protein [Armatimonadota bacterium]